VRAREPLDSTVDFNVFIKVCSLGKAEFTAIYWALIRSLIGMDSEVIEEVVPFSECFTTCFMVTL
jgi:hypothetical protein